jgi:type II secretory pathway pseudopilin PulG
MKQTRFAKVAGFTLDQTILVVAVIAILATIIISSVAWEVLTKANSTKLTAHLNQIGESVGQYYQDTHVSEGPYIWPDNAAKLEAYLAGYSKDGNNLNTPLGGSTLAVLSFPSTYEQRLGVSGSTGGGTCDSAFNDCYITVQITNIPLQEVRAANEAIDGAAEDKSTRHERGRLRWSDDSVAESALVTLTYYAVKK